MSFKGFEKGEASHALWNGKIGIIKKSSETYYFMDLKCNVMLIGSFVVATMKACIKGKGDTSLKWVEPLVERSTVMMDEDMEQEIILNKNFFMKLSLIRRFKGFWPSMGNLHKWILHH